MSKSDKLADNAKFFAEMETAAKRAIEKKIKIIEDAIRIFEEKHEVVPERLRENLAQAKEELKKFDVKH